MRISQVRHVTVVGVYANIFDILGRHQACPIFVNLFSCGFELYTRYPIVRPNRQHRKNSKIFAVHCS